MLTFVSAVFLLLITPGPGVLSTAGVGSSFGKTAGLRYLIGLFIGTNLVALAVITGVAGLLLAHEGARTVLLIASTLYLVYLALRIATAGSSIAFITREKPPSIFDGITLQIINPKAYVVNTAVFTGFPLAGFSFGTEMLTKCVLLNAIWIPIHLLWLSLGIGIDKLDLDRRWQRLINIAMAIALLGVVGLAALYS
ncbi:MAG: LysE family translocator [Gammaproteobacteria bacterium]|nr:LysE family translocator [Gammaproteobacteria bacterium]